LHLAQCSLSADQLNQAKEYKAKALELSWQMEAPKQIQRVNQAFDQGAIK
jgi:hypothetical protein